MYYFIILATIFIASRADLMYENISIAATIPQYHLLTIIYTFVCSFFFAYKMYILYKSFYHPHKFCLSLIIMAGIAMPIGSLFTYGSSELYSQIHVYTSIVSCVIFLFLLFIYMYYMSIDYTDIYLQCYRQFYLSVNILAIIVVVIGRINGIIEIFYIIIVSLTLKYYDKHICKK